jgi:hypothetical protein
MAVSPNDQIPGQNQSLLGEQAVFYAHASYFKIVDNPVFPDKVTDTFGLFG